MRFWYFPGAHSVQRAAPVWVSYVPRSHILHAAKLATSAAFEYRPAWHAMQAFAPGVSWYVPGPQAVQASASSSRNSSGFVKLQPAFLSQRVPNFPVAQRLHTFPPGLFWYVPRVHAPQPLSFPLTDTTAFDLPRSQLIQAEARGTSLYFPAGHGTSRLLHFAWLWPAQYVPVAQFVSHSQPPMISVHVLERHTVGELHKPSGQ